jgi:heme-degrading monooxygenase HmoA
VSSDGPIITIFRNRLRPDADGYADEAVRMVEAAKAMPGFIEVKTYTADDGERVTIVGFESEKTQRAWREHAEHRVAQKRGRAEFYSWYRLQVCQQLRETTFGA